jgi:hypothetical protein
VRTTNDPYMKHRQEIRDKYRCTECKSNAYCYRRTKPDMTIQHIELSPEVISLWAHQIQTGQACLAYPPRQVKEIDAMMAAAEAGLSKRKTRPRSDSDTSSMTSGHAPVIHYNIGHSSRYPATPSHQSSHSGSSKQSVSLKFTELIRKITMVVDY